jgi:hypothetical protein
MLSLLQNEALYWPSIALVIEDWSQLRKPRNWYMSLHKMRFVSIERVGINH